MSHAGQYIIDPYYESEDWRDLRVRVLNRDQSTCFYCHGEAHQADHVIPRKKGGKDQLRNLVACCATCNKTAGNRVFKNRSVKQQWILINRPIESPRALIPHSPRKPQYPTVKPTEKSLFRKKLEQRSK